ncbi:hypothetical protein DPMN_139783 [Dreissena polymorpha]|uniref:Uncharacterized protein n=1 Tax=Dreissena polymorpha TaxID=45954 RepID=A0A9D4JL39_DREPO|nr:hypothetical protein DPMN_139783 [Dreissena polymorpha]
MLGWLSSDRTFSTDLLVEMLGWLSSDRTFSTDLLVEMLDWLSSDRTFSTDLLVEMLGWLSSDRTFSTDFNKSKTIEISQLPNIIHMSTINTSLFCVITSKSM